MDDETLICEIAAKNPVAINEFYTRWFPQFVRLATWLLGDPHWAEDVAQETVIRIITSAPQYERGRKPEAWFTIILRNLAEDRRRREKRRRAESLSAGGSDEDGPQAIDVADDTPPPEVVSLARERHRAVRAAVELLPDVDREVVVLRDIEGRKAPEVARILGISTATVGGRLFRARQRLAGLLQTHWPELFPPGPP